jgi:hypothetical protein
MIDNELALTVEQGLEIAFPAGTIESVVLFNHHHRQAAPLGIDAIVVLGELLLVGE